MKVLSLFDGMGCGALAMYSARIPIDKYDAFEIDKYAICATTRNFPFINHHGDVFGADFTQFKGYDILVGGSPCTYWSIAQKNNRETEASGMGWELFSQYVRALKEAQPRYFIYENNKSMSNAIRESITEAFGFEPICINSALVSAQNRQRLYWVGKRNADGTYSKVEIEQPEDKGILLKDILETGEAWQDKAFAYTTRCQADTLSKHRHTMVAEPVCVAQRGRYSDSGNRSVKGEGPIEQYYEVREGGKTNALTTVQKDNYVAEPVRVGCYPSPDGTLKNSQGMRIYGVEGKSVNLTAQGGGMGAKTGLYAIPLETDLVPYVEAKLDKAVEKYGYVPEMWNPYNNAEITEKSPTLTTQCGSKTSSSTVLVAQPTCYAVPICHKVPQEVTVRKYTCDIERLKALLRDHKTMSNNQIADALNRPTTLVEHWFRKDDCFAVPDADVWFELKKLLKIQTPEFDDYVTVFETRDGIFEKGNRCYDVEGKKSTLMTGKTDNIIAPVRSEGCPLCFAAPCEWDEDGKPIKAICCADGKVYPVYEVKDGLITVKGKTYPIKLADGFYIIRKLTVRECMRLQTVPEWYDFSVVSDTQAYKMLGNGWTVEVISHLLSYIKQEEDKQNEGF